MTRCAACHRPLKSPDSIAIGMGPGCLRKAVHDSAGPDLFAKARQAAIETLKAAAAECTVLGVTVSLSIEERA